MVDRGWYAVRTVLLMAGVFVVAVLAGGSATARQEARGWEGLFGGLADGMTVLTVVVALGAPLLLLVRRTHQANVAWGLGLLSWLVPLGPVMALVLPQTIRDQEQQEGETLSFVYVVGLVIYFVRDLLGPTPSTSLVRGLTSGGDLSSTLPVGLNVFGVAALFLVLAVAPIAIGYYRRAQLELDVTRSDATEQRAVVGEMSAQLWRQAERDLIAREVHDVIGHRLSLLSLHSGGLEMAAKEDRQLAESARYVRQNAQQAMDDLRSLLGVLREPWSAGSDGWLGPSVTSLADLARVVDEMAETGGPVASCVFLTEPEQADPVLAQSVYRIVQELLTNARKHAPGAVVRLRVAGGPEQGVTVEASNPVLPGAVCGEGSGLRGIRERVELLGGRVEVPGEHDLFTVRIQLPWLGRMA